MSNQSASFRLAYDGPALADHTMDVKELAPALLSIGELLEEVNKLVNPPHVKMVVNIRATKEGSVQIDLVAAQTLLDQAKTLFSSDGISAVLNAVEILKLIFGATGVLGVVKLIQWLKGRRITSVTKLETGDYNVIAEGGEMIVTNEKELTLFRTFSVRQKIETFIRKPLLSQGISQVTVTTPDTEETVTQEESSLFIAPVGEEEAQQELVSTMTLQLVSIAFQSDYKWRFNDGMSSFTADMLDKEFREKVEKSEVAFAKDDIFTAEVRTRQFILNGELKSERTILKVIEYRSASTAKMRLPGL